MKKLCVFLITSTVLLANNSLKFTPKPPKLDNSGYILLSEKTNKIIASNNPDKKVAPASLTKLMTLFIVASALDQKTVALSDKVLISKKAWQQPGSRMFVKAGDYVELEKLIAGSAVASGNDATVAIAEHIAGSTERFVELMNQTAKKLGMKNTKFMNPTGLPNKQHLTTPKDLSILAKAWYDYFPEQTKWFSTKYFQYNKIKQHNRNKLLWSNKYVDGMKTGYTKDAGYCLVASADKDNNRIITVVTGAKSKNARFEQSSQLINYAYHFYENKKIITKNQELNSVKIFQGASDKVPFAAADDIIITKAKSSDAKIQIEYKFNKNITAPILKNQVLGYGKITFNNETFKTKLIALEAVDRGNIWQITKGYLLSLVS